MVGCRYFFLISVDHDLTYKWVSLFRSFQRHGILPDDDRQVLIMDTIQFIRAFASIISKAAMQTYHSALALMPSDSLLSQRYSAMSRPSLKSSWSGSDSGFGYSPITHDPAIILSINSSVYNSASFGDIIALSLRKGEIAFSHTKTGKETGSRIRTAGRFRLIAFSPDGQWIVTCRDRQRGLKIWNAQTRTHAKTIAKKLDHRQFNASLTLLMEKQSLSSQVPT